MNAANENTCTKCEGWGCSWCNPRALPMTATKARVIEENEVPPDEPISKKEAEELLLKVKALRAVRAKQDDLLQELKLIAMLKLGKEVTKQTRLLFKCAHCDRHSQNYELFEYEGQFYHRGVCWRK